MELLNTAVGLMSLVLGGFAIWLALHFYTKSKDTEKETAVTLAAIKAQSEALQRLTGRWMDRFTRHATEPKPADEGLLTLVSAVATLPQTLLAHLSGQQGAAQQTQEALLREVIDGYVGLYYYCALTNVVGQALLPSEDDFDSTIEWHKNVQAIVDRSAADFAKMAQVLGQVDAARLQASALKHLLDEAINTWRPHVRYTSQAFETRRESASS